MVEPDKPHDDVIWCLHIACRISKAVDTLRICNGYCFSMATLVTQKQMGLSVMLHVHCLSCLSWIYLVLAGKFWERTSILTLSTCIDAVMLSCI